MFEPKPREGMPSPQLDRAAFEARFRSQFMGHAFDALQPELDRMAAAAWAEYSAGNKAPHTRKAGPGYADPDYDLAVDWIAARAAVDKAQARHEDRSRPARILLVNASTRSEHTCPGEMSKTWRLVELARGVLLDGGAEVEVLDLSRLASEYGRHIHPCKACFSTAAALCHWPCSCYPNYSLGQTQDWMNEIYPMWVEAHGIMIVTPVHWYMASSPLKLMMDRMVCADGGNPDPTATHGKHAAEAKRLELKGWPYPRHLEDRLFAVVVHGDVEGASGVRRALSDWLTFMSLRPAGGMAEVDRYIGYMGPYATSHDALDKDSAMQEETRNAARTLLNAVDLWRADRLPVTDGDLEEPRPK
ncbi:flavodoxin family protein [Rubellimicrobium roseum]|uniref:Flavodoxin family protein n=1 Tax=Rubellimicrobium roseum TaxID=687525 RepID=A0A5C4NJ11_9RHOB|nr:flavodoxin family protein [Rubellimicrobium roseum]TNC74092.1 flavodoxin family protein [Rubellimicrobium roseum]